MSHEVETMFSVKLTPWHGLGNVLEEAPTSAEAIVQAGLDWEVQKRDIFMKDVNDEMQEVKNRKALVRQRFDDEGLSDDILSVVSDQYEPLQNVEAFSFFDDLITQDFAEYETAGALFNGRKIWVLARMKEEFRVSREDVVRQYLMLCNGHDGQTGIMVQPTPIRVVCNNTLQCSLAHGMVFRTAHKGNMRDKMEEAKQVAGFSAESFMQIKMLFRHMNARSVTEEMINDYLFNLIPPAEPGASERVQNGVEAQHRKIKELFESGANAQIEQKHTMWELYNAAIEFCDYFMGKRAQDRAGYLAFGQGAAFKRRALEIAMHMLDLNEEE